MLKDRFRRPSPALVISVVALVFAVGGGSFALAITDKKSDKKIAKKVANKQITRRAPSLSVSHANTAAHATTADSATSAPPAAFLRITSAGTVDSTRTRGVLGVNNPAAPIYCLHLSFTPTTAIASRGIDSAGATATAQVGLGADAATALGCPSGFQDAVVQAVGPGNNGSIWAWFN
jgi:hypothetical protein